MSDKKQILILGAGMVARPMVNYLLSQENFYVTLADCECDKALRIMGDNPKGRCEDLNVDNQEMLKNQISGHDLVISLVPYVYHPQIARACIAEKKNMITTSYVSDAMRAMDQDARDAGILILNEIGLDPGIDHMSAMKIIHSVQNRGGNIVSFYSYCGGLPSPEHNTNPLGYKFSWSPKGVVLAAKNAARYLKESAIQEIDNKNLFAHTWELDFDEIGTLEAYANRDSLPYIDLYGLDNIQTMYRGTLRYPGWCETWHQFVRLGLLDTEDRSGLEPLDFAQIMAEKIRAESQANLKQLTADFLGIDAESHILKKMDWLGLFSNSKLPNNCKSILDALACRLLEKMPYKEGETDMIVLYHDFLAAFPDNRLEKIQSTLIDYGQPGGDSSMSRTVSLPAAIAAKGVLQNQIREKGVHIPVLPSVYEPVLKELETLGISFKEKILGA